MQALSDKRILMVIAFKDFQDDEYGVPWQIFEEAGVKITTVSASMGIATGMFGKEVTISITTSEVDVADYDAVVFAGGRGLYDHFDDPNFNRIIKEAVEKGKILGAICISPVMLAKAGVLRGKRATVWMRPSRPIEKMPDEILKDNGAIYEAQSVVVDGKIVTANGPKAAKEFGEKIVEILSGQ